MQQKDSRRGMSLSRSSLKKISSKRASALSQLGSNSPPLPTEKPTQAAGSNASVPGQLKRNPSDVGSAGSQTCETTTTTTAAASVPAGGGTGDQSQTTAQQDDDQIHLEQRQNRSADQSPLHSTAITATPTAAVISETKSGSINTTNPARSGRQVSVDMEVTYV